MAEFDWVYSFVPYIAVAAVSAVVIVLLVMWYRANAAPAPGRVLGKYRVFIRYSPTFHREIEGILVDATELFVGANVWPLFADLLGQELGHMIEKAKGKPEAEAKLKEAKDKIGKINPHSDCTVIVTRQEGRFGSTFGDKHIIVALTQNRALTSFASHEPESEFTLSFGPVAQGVISGEGHTIPKTFQFQNKRFKIGSDITVHVMIPDDPQTQISTREDVKKLAVKVDTELKKFAEKLKQFVDKAPAAPAEAAEGAGAEATKDLKETLLQLTEDLSRVKYNLGVKSDDEAYATLIAIAPTAVDAKEQLHSKDETIKNKDLELEDMGRQLSDMAAELDRLTRAVKGFTTEDQKLPDVTPKKLDVIDFICLIAAPTLFYYIAGALGAEPIIGVLAGLSLGGVVVYKRH